MADPITLTTLLIAGGTVVAQTMIEEGTKAAWQGIKATFQDLFGRRATSIFEKLETDDTREAGRIELQRVLETVNDEEAAAIAPAAERLAVALREDSRARTILEDNRINLDLDVGGDVLLERISGSTTMNVRARSEGSFTLSDVRMGREKTSGN